MREIKFRAWNGNEMINVDVLAISACTWGCPDYGKNGVSLAYQPSVKVMQYTGLKDKDGVEIYEGDIIECKFHPMWYERISWDGPPDAVCEVYYDYSGFGLKVKGEKDQRYASCRDLLDALEHESDLLVRMENTSAKVIGNIYQNNEMLI